MLVIRLFGSFDIAFQQRSVGKFASRKARSLLILLILGRSQALSRDALATKIWPDFDQDRARKSLNTELWRLGKSLTKGGIPQETVLDASGERLQFRPQIDCWLDIEAFEDGTAPALTEAAESADPAAIRRVEEAVALYRGDLLEAVYDDWCLVHREALRGRFLAAAEFLLAAAMARRDWTNALARAQVLLATDPLLEHIHRAVMRCHYHMGNRPAALRQFEYCAEVLRRELGVEPMGETTQVYDTIRAVSPKRVQIDPAGGREVLAPPAALPERRPPLQEVAHAISDLDRARLWLVDASEQLKGR